MKSKAQKRLEAVERLERPVQANRYYTYYRKRADELQEKRRTEAKRLREKFNIK